MIKSDQIQGQVMRLFYTSTDQKLLSIKEYRIKLAADW